MRVCRRRQLHDRARLYHVHQKPLYRAIGEPGRYRRPTPARRAVERLMLLDAVLASPILDWLTTEREKAIHLATLMKPGKTRAIHSVPPPRNLLFYPSFI
jgi:hypothetical protein